MAYQNGPPTRAGVFSIRYKILILLTIIPVIVLLIYITMAMRIFADDKIAYVYDSSASASRALGNQINLQINSLLSASRSVLQEFVLTGQFSTISEAAVKTDERLVWISAFKKASGGFDHLGTVEAKPLVYRMNVQDLGGDIALQQILAESLQVERLVRLPFRDDRVLVIQKVLNPENKEEYFFALLFRMTDVVNDFRVPGQFESYLVGSDGRVFLGPSGSQILQIQNLAPLRFLSQLSDASSGTEEVKSKAGESLLASYYRTAQGQLWAVTLVPKDQALSAVETLIWKSVFFFMLLICGTVIISLFASSGLTGALSDLFLATRRVAQGQFDIRVKVNSSDEVGSLAASFNAMAGEVSRLLSETAQKARMESELKTAQTVQETLFPSNFSEAAGTYVVGFYEPASECGGDWWFHNVINDKLFIWMGDATGHGAPAALITSAARSATSILEGMNLGPAQALDLMNRAIYDVSKGQIMMTFFVACYDPATGELTYSNASHEAPYLIRKKEGELKKRDLLTLNDVNNPRLGQDRGSKYEQAKISFGPGDRLLVYTDGVTDLRSPADEALGERAFIKMILEFNQGFPPITEVMAKMSDRMRDHRQGAPLVDDLTYFMVQVKE